MKNKSIPIGLILIVMAIFVVSSCDEDPVRPEWPLSAEIFHSSVGKQVAFTALTHSATNWLWDFGDGNTSTEKNPVYVYEEGGYYVATLTASDDKGNSVSAEVKLAIELTPYALLTGDHTAEGYDGKTWKLTANHPSQDRLANADANFSVADGAPENLPQGAFDLYLGMGEVYQDEFTFYYDGRYKHDVKADGAAFGGIVYQFVMQDGGAHIVNAGGASFGMCTAKYTPEENATFTYVENEDFPVYSVYGPSGVLTYNNVSTLDFSGTEFIGFRDFQRKVIVQEITDNTMRLVMFMAAAPDYLPANTHALILTFEVVR